MWKHCHGRKTEPVFKNPDFCVKCFDNKCNIAVMWINKH